MSVYGIKYTKWNELKRKILKRDEFSCQVCGRKERILEIHHIVPYRTSKSNKFNNLIVLCKKCHTSLHSFLSIFFHKECRPLRTKNFTYCSNNKKYNLYYDRTESLYYLIPKTHKSKIPKIESHTQPKWHLWTYGGYRSSSKIFNNN